MPATSFAAEKLKKRNGPFTTTIDGVGVTLRRPDLRYLIYTRTIPAPLIAKVGTLISTWVGSNLSEDNKSRDETDGDDALLLLNIMACNIFIDPKVVYTQEEFDQLDEGEQSRCVTADSLDVDFKEKALIAAMGHALEGAAVEVAAAERFPGDERSTGTSSDVQGVRSETEPSAPNPE